MKAKGFTLIEVLLAMMLLSIVMYIGSLSFSVFSERWSKELGGFNTDVSDARKLLLLRQVLRGVSNYLYKDAKGDMNYFFNGDRDSLSFVTKQPLFNQHSIALVELVVKTSDDGLQQLWYFESQLNAMNSNDIVVMPNKASVLLLQADNIRFNYYGWQDRADFNNYFENSAVKPAWRTAYSAADLKLIPYAVNISWADNEPLIIPISADNGYNFRYRYDETN